MMELHPCHPDSLLSALQFKIATSEDGPGQEENETAGPTREAQVSEEHTQTMLFPRRGGEQAQTISLLNGS